MKKMSSFLKSIFSTKKRRSHRKTHRRTRRNKRGG